MARERAQIRGGKILAILKGEMLNSRSFVHLKQISESQYDMYEDNTDNITTQNNFQVNQNLELAPLA